MDADEGALRRSISVRGLTGIQVGTIGGVAMLCWFAAATPLLGEPWWLIPNLTAASLTGARSIGNGFGWVTIIGAAIHLLIAGAVGGAAGLVHTGGRLFGLMVALACYLLGYYWLWKRFAPLLTDAPQSVLAAGYFIYGSALGWHRDFVRRHRSD